MKKLMLTSILAVLVAGMTTVRAQDMPEEYLGLPGDNLNLYAVMKLFQESETLEGFEKNLNSEKTGINNLDLNGDNIVDYLAVSDYVDGDVHNIVLRAAIGRDEYQDVAVFTVQRFSNGSVEIQLVGDEALYGKDYIIEPIYAETPNPGYRGKSYKKVNVTVYTTTPYEIAYWPVVRFIYHPHYVIWRSSWYWGYYPVYWHPWNPWYWHYYYGYHYNWHNDYYGHYHHWHHYRYHGYHDYYYKSVRAHSVRVDRMVREGSYRSTYSRPDQRREGEAYYARTQAERGNAPRVSSSSATRPTRTAPQSGREQYSKGTSPAPARRTPATVTSSGRSTTGNAPARRTETSVRTTGNPTTSQRSEANRPASKSSTTQTGYSRSSSGSAPAARRTETGRTVSKSASVSTGSSRSSAPSAGSSRSSGRSSAPSASSQRSSSRSSSPAARTSGSSSRSTGHSAGSSRSGGSSSSRSSKSGNVSSKSENRSSSDRRSGR